MAPPPSIPDNDLLQIIIDQGFEILGHNNVLFRAKDKEGPWEKLRLHLLDKGYCISTKCLHNKFHRKQLGKESRILQEYKRRHKCILPPGQEFNKDVEHHQGNVSKDHLVDNFSPVQGAEQLPEENVRNLVVSCDLTELHRMKFEQFHAAIKHISPVPFHVLYWNVEQIFFWSKFVQNNNYPVVFTILDKVTQKFKIPELLQSEQVYLLILAIKIPKGLGHLNNNDDDLVLPLAQALSENLDRHIFVKFISEYLKEANPPTRIISNFCTTILDAFCLVFNKSSCKDYNENCFQYLQGLKANKDFIKTVIQIDSIALLDTISNLPSFKQISSRSVRRFYLNCFMYLSTVNNCPKFLKAAQDIILLMTSTTQNTLTQKICEKLKIEFESNTELLQIKNRFLKRAQESQRLDFMKLELDKSDFEGPPDRVNKICTYINEMFCNVILTLKEFSSVDLPNPLFVDCSEWMWDCKKILFHFPMWSAVMVENEKSVIHTSHFFVQNHLKMLFCNQDQNQNIGPPSVPEFVELHFEMIETLSNEV